MKISSGRVAPDRAAIQRSRYNSRAHHSVAFDDCAGLGLGQLLLAAALAYSVVRQNKQSAVLQIAGGASNTPASKLYQKFGFENVGGEGVCARDSVVCAAGWLTVCFVLCAVFGTPNENLMVLWNIENTLQNLNLQGEPRAGSKQINSASQVDCH